MTLDIERLAAVAPELSRAELEGLARAFERRGGDEPDDFVAWLHARGAIAEDTLHIVARSARVPVLVAPVESLAKAGGLRVLGSIGRGGMGEVLLARDERLHRTVAVKRLDPRHLGSPQLVRRFVAEAQLTAQLDHPSIVPVYAVEAPPGEAPSYAMKLVRGRTLRAWWNDAVKRAQAGEPQPDRARLPARLELFVQLCEPLAYAHARGVIHRDLKPDNVMVGPFGEVFVMDWGVARLTGGPDEGDLLLAASEGPEATAAGDAVGTPSYMSPEQARAENATLDARSDQFALGLLLFELSTLRRARASVTGGALPMHYAAQKGKVDPIAPLGEPLPRELVAVIKKATAFAREDRYADVTALADDVRRVLRGEAVLARPDSAWERLARSVGKNRERVAAGLVGAVLLMVAAVGLTVAVALGLREVDRASADARAARQLSIGTLTSERARALDRSLLRDEGLLRGLAAAAQRALESGAEGQVFLAEDYADPARAPKDLTLSGVYQAKASVRHADIAVAPGFDRVAGRAQLAALASLQEEMLGVLVGSAEDGPLEEGAARARILTIGTPVVWAYVATEQGALVGYPGVGTYPPDYDPRTRPWYREGIARKGPGWGRPYIDESGMGLLISCGMPLFDGEGRPAGVVGLDVTVASLVSTWLAPGDLDAEGFLLDTDGNVVVRSSGNGEATVSVRPFPYPDLLPKIQDPTPSGLSLSGGRLFAWSHLQAVPWTYVVVGESGALLGD